MRKHRNIPVFIPHEGCPHDCAFCNQRKITGFETSVTPEMADEIIRQGLATIDTSSGQFWTEAAFFGGSFTALSLETQEAFLRVADRYRHQLDGVRISTRPDAVTPEGIRLLKQYGVSMVELGVQSADDEVLRMNSRGHTFADVAQAAEMIREAGIGLGLQMMTGLYGSTPALDCWTADQIIAFKPDCVRIYPTLTLKGTALAELYDCGTYQPYDLETTVELCAELLSRFWENGIEVIRLGLHAGDELQSAGNIVSGPFHPAFGELVEGRIWRDRLEREIQRKNLHGCVFLVEAPAAEISKIVGQHKCNRIYFEEKYQIRLKLKIRKEEEDGI